ncbi:hypothetical protein EBR56_01375 [bacterium]|nr:hypothetical protein [bacterium]
MGVLTVILSIDSASACRLFRHRYRPRCRVVRLAPPVCGSIAACQPGESVVIVEAVPQQCCVPADGSSHAVIVEPEQAVIASAPQTPTPPAGDESPDATPSIVAESPRAPTPMPVREPVAPLKPIAPASAVEPASVPEPEFRTAAEILAESAEKERLEKLAVEALKPAAPEPQFKTSAEKEAAEKAALDAAKEQPSEPPMEKAPAPMEKAPAKQPAPKPIEENFFDEENNEPAAKTVREDVAPMTKKDPPPAAVEDLFGEPEAATPPADAERASPKKAAEEKAAEEKAADEKAADEKPGEEPDEPTEQTEDDPFASRDREPVRRWIDATGRHETIGWLVEVHPDRVRIFKANGCYTTVPRDRLSRHDQSYVTQAGERIAAKRPAATDTARR